jgi:phospholipid/cholesterol/gamma-HCH transport system permease protein
VGEKFYGGGPFFKMSGVAELKFLGEEAVELVISGDWKLCGNNARPDVYAAELSTRPAIRTVNIRPENLEIWDSSLLSFTAEILRACENKGVAVVFEKMPPGIQKLIALMKTSVHEDTQSPQSRKKRGTFLDFFSRIWPLIFLRTKNCMRFLGEVCGGVIEFARGKVHIREQDFAVILQDVGIKSLPIVSLISFLVGLILAFISILQLARFGATIYVADLVGISMMREMGCIMTGVIMSGRT